MTTPRMMVAMIKRLREAQRLSQADLGRRARITREYVNRLEASRYDPTVGTLQRIAKALGVKVTALLE